MSNIFVSPVQLMSSNWKTDKYYNLDLDLLTRKLEEDEKTKQKAIWCFQNLNASWWKCDDRQR